MRNRKVCSVETCGNIQHSRGYCPPHYCSWRRYGDPLITKNARHGQGEAWIRAALETRSPEDNTCWLDWPYGVEGVSGDYPAVSAGKVSHIVLELTGHPRPPAPKNYALHSCDTPMCLNPKHLRWGTQQENMDDKVKRGRVSRAGGRLTGDTKLTEQEISEIRFRHQPGINQNNKGNTTILAAEYGVSRSLINEIIRKGRQ